MTRQEFIYYTLKKGANCMKSTVFFVNGIGIIKTKKLLGNKETVLTELPKDAVLRSASTNALDNPVRQDKRDSYYKY